MGVVARLIVKLQQLITTRYRKQRLRITVYNGIPRQNDKHGYALRCRSFCRRKKLEGISIDLRQESLKGCSLSSLNKCYGSLPPDGSTPSNLLEEIGQIADAQTCQSFCKDLYPGACTWFMFDRTTNDCKLFSGSLDDLRADCKEVGYAKET